MFYSSIDGRTTFVLCTKKEEGIKEKEKMYLNCGSEGKLILLGLYTVFTVVILKQV